MRERKEQVLDLPVYESTPPNWIPRAHVSADLGYPGFFPPRPAKDEDALSTTSLKSGFVSSQAVSAETFSAQSTVSESLRSDGTIQGLEDLMNELFTRRRSQIPSIPPSTFRIPSRVTLNDVKRNAWFADLANPDVPLYKLGGRNVPHGAKGPDLIDQLHSNNIAIPRAVWFLRVFGANETAGLRNKPSYNPTQYSIDWANVVTSHLKKQLLEIKLPSAPRPGLNIKQTFKGVLADFDSREKWVSLFSYCLQLTRIFYCEGLVDHFTILSWIVEQMTTCNLAQAAFVTRIADEYLDGMTKCRPLIRPFAEACLLKLSEIPNCPEPELLMDTEILLKVLLQRLCLSLPDAFISPRLWIAHGKLLTQVLTDEPLVDCYRDSIGGQIIDVRRALASQSSSIQRRNDAMLFRNLPSLVSARLGSAVSDIELLNSISHKSDITSLPYFPLSSRVTPAFVEKLERLLTWSVTSLQFGDHRVFAAVSMIRSWRDQTVARSNRRQPPPRMEVLQDHLFEWLDSSDVAGQAGALNSVILLYGKLVKHDLFSYAAYIQRLIARGDLGLSLAVHTSSRHYKFLQSIPLHDSTSSLVRQRKGALYGTRVRETPEDHNEKEIRKEIRLALADAFGAKAVISPSRSELLASCPLLLSATRYEQVRTFRFWLLPLLRQFFSNASSDITKSHVVRGIYCGSVELMTETRCFSTLLELTFCMLEHSSTLELLITVLDTLNRHASIWACMDVMGEIVSHLFKAHEIWKARGVQSRVLLALLTEFDDNRYLRQDSRDQVLADISSFTLALQPVTGHSDPVPALLPEVVGLANDSAADTPSLLANGLWIKYRRSPDWAWKVWNITVGSLVDIPLTTVDNAERRFKAKRYVTFLKHLDQHLPKGLDEPILHWFLTQGRDTLDPISADAWNVLITVLISIIIMGSLKATTVLSGLVYPVWQASAALSDPESAVKFDAMLTAATDLFSQLISGDASIEKMELPDEQCIRTRREDAFRPAHFPLLVAAIPALVAIENNKHISEAHRIRCGLIRSALCEMDGFRRGVFGDLAVVRAAFEQPLSVNQDACGDLTKPIIEALKMVLCESMEDIDLSTWAQSSLLSPWKIGATAVHLQFVLRRIGVGPGLDQITTMLLEQTLSSEEAYFVAQMTKGVGSTISSKFVNHGLQKVTEILNVMSSNDAVEQSTSLRRASEVLRALVYITEPLRDEIPQGPAIDPDVQDQFFSALSSKFSEVVPSQDGTSSPIVILLARLLQFDLGLHGIWTEATKEASGSLVKAILDLVLGHATGESRDLIPYALLLDTLYFLVDEIPKAIAFDPFRHYPDMQATDLPSDLPLEYGKQLRSMMPMTSSSVTVENLVSSHRDSSGNLVYDGPVLNRPWEWIENLGEPATAQTGEDTNHSAGWAQTLVKNTGSLSLETFGAQMTGARIIQSPLNATDARARWNARSFEDDYGSESIFLRDWLETRVEAEASPGGRAKNEGDSAGGAAANTAPKRASPISTKPSPSRHSATDEAMDVGSVASTTSTSKKTTSTKRKAPSDDDDIVIVDGPEKPRKPRTKTRKR